MFTSPVEKDTTNNTRVTEGKTGPTQDGTGAGDADMEDLQDRYETPVKVLHNRVIKLSLDSQSKRKGTRRSLSANRPTNNKQADKLNKVPIIPLVFDDDDFAAANITPTKGSTCSPMVIQTFVGTDRKLSAATSDNDLLATPLLPSKSWRHSLAPAIPSPLLHDITPVKKNRCFSRSFNFSDKLNSAVNPLDTGCEANEEPTNAIVLQSPPRRSRRVRRSVTAASSPLVPVISTPPPCVPNTTAPPPYNSTEQESPNSSSPSSASSAKKSRRHKTTDVQLQ